MLKRLKRLNSKLSKRNPQIAVAKMLVRTTPMSAGPTGVAATVATTTARGRSHESC